MNKQQIGKFLIVGSLLDKNLDLVQKILSRVVVVRAEYIYHHGGIEYIAISNEFEEIAEFGTLPTYKVNVHFEADGPIVKFIKEETRHES